MLTSLLTLLTLLTINLALALTPPPDKPALPFSQTCTNITLTGDSALTATCLSTTNEQLDNYLDLNLCVGIDHNTNELTWGVYGKYTVYCDDCKLETKGKPASDWLTCVCQSTGNSGPAAVSSLKLGELGLPMRSDRMR